MNRRAFIAGLGGGAAWPMLALAQQSATPVIGILSGGSPDMFAPLQGPLREGLAEAGFVEGKNLAFEYRWAQGHFERLPELAIDLVGRRPAVIATNTLPAALAAKGATNTIPVVFVIGEDPIKVGLVTSLNRPSANVTGGTNFMNVLGAKRLELAGEIVPKTQVIALLVNGSNPNAEADTADLRAAADALGRRVIVLTASSEAELRRRSTPPSNTAQVPCSLILTLTFSAAATSSQHWLRATAYPRSTRCANSSSLAD